MENIINVMKRHELKYVLTKEQNEYLVNELKSHMIIDKYGLTSIASLYYDTPSHELVRKSLEKPTFKEKIRLRSYGLASKGSPVYLELKRKYDGIVYKRRIQSTIDDVDNFFLNDKKICDGQIEKEISYFKNYYKKLVPSCLIIYDRIAYYQNDSDLRLTIDYNPRYRMDNLNLNSSMDGKSILGDGYSILEIKVQDSMPLWLTSILDRGKIYLTSLSKYGEAYKKEIKNIIN